jgi:hypothetical protein
MGFCEQGNELLVFINGVEFVEKLSSFDRAAWLHWWRLSCCLKTTDRKSVLGPWGLKGCLCKIQDDRQEVCAGTLQRAASGLTGLLCKIQKFGWYLALHRKRCVPVTKTIRAMLFCEVVAVGYNISTWCRRNVSCWMLNLSVRVLTRVVQIFRSLGIWTRFMLYTAASFTESRVDLHTCDSKPSSTSC